MGIGIFTSRRSSLISSKSPSFTDTSHSKSPTHKCIPTTPTYFFSFAISKICFRRHSARTGMKTSLRNLSTMNSQSVKFNNWFTVESKTPICKNFSSASWVGKTTLKKQSNYSIATTILMTGKVTTPQSQ